MDFLEWFVSWLGSCSADFFIIHTYEFVMFGARLEAQLVVYTHLETRRTYPSHSHLVSCCLHKSINQHEELPLSRFQRDAYWWIGAKAPAMSDAVVRKSCSRPAILK